MQIFEVCQQIRSMETAGELGTHGNNIFSNLLLGIFIFAMLSRE
jgi:hypothetical protein